MLRRSALVLGLSLLVLPAALHADDWTRPFHETGTIRIVTTDQDGSVRDRPVWIVVEGGAAWVRTNGRQRNPNDKHPLSSRLRLMTSPPGIHVETVGQLKPMKNNGFIANWFVNLQYAMTNLQFAMDFSRVGSAPRTTIRYPCHPAGDFTRSKKEFGVRSTLYAAGVSPVPCVSQRHPSPSGQHTVSCLV